MNRLLLLAAVLVASAPAMAQTTLAPGDIAIVGMYTDAPDGFAFVALVPMQSGTVIRFTDNGWLAAGGFRTGENIITWTASANVAPGTVVTFDCPFVAGAVCSASTGTTANVAGPLNGLSSDGDQILAYQGTETAPTFVYALNNEGLGVWQADATNTNTSALPAGLTNGTTAFALIETDNFAYTGPTSGTRGQLLGFIGNGSNWTGNDATKPAFPNAFVVGSGGEPVESPFVEFNPTSRTVTEGATANLTVVLGIANDQAPAGLNAPVMGMIVFPAASNSDITSVTGTFGFPVGAPAGATTPVTIVTTDDATFEATESIPFTFSNVTGATSGGPFTLTINDNDTAPPPPPVVLNEIDSDTPGTDVAEFVEILGPPSTSLAGLVLVLYNGTGAVSYLTVDLAGQATDATGRFVVCDQPANVPGCTLDLPGTAATGFLQNGEDGVALYTAAAASFPNGTAATTAGLADAVVYGTSDPLASALLTGLGFPTTYQFEENENAAAATQSLARLNIATSGGTVPSALFYVQAPTPGAANAGAVTVNETAGVDNIAGYRLLGAPVVRPTQAPVRVADLAPINLIQGIPAGSASGAQYPGASGPNLLTTYAPSAPGGPFFPPSSTDVGLPPAAGFFWYFYDQDIPLANIPPAFGPGTSRSYELTNTAFALSLTGIAVDDRLNGTMTPGPYAATLPVSSSGLYMAANPFAYPVLLSSYQVTGGTAGTNFSVYDPTTATYQTLTSTNVVSPWQGVFLEVTAPTGATVTLSASSRNVVPTSTVALVGRGVVAEGRLNLRLDGVLASGTAVADHATVVRFETDAVAGWDRHDGSKLLPPQADAALVAFRGVRDGSAVRQAVLSLPGDASAVTPLAFRATGAGSFTLTWDAAGLPANTPAALRDLTTGARVDLRTAQSYTFTSAATDWTDRFEFAVGRNAVAAEGAPASFELGAAYPNPATQRATLALSVDAAQHVTAVVVDALGRTVATVFDGPLAAGAIQALTVDAGRLAPGVYVVRVQGETFAQSRRLVVAR